MTLTQWLLLPAFCHVALVLFVAFRMGRARFMAARAGRVKIADIAVDGSRWPDDVRQIANNYQNQFEVPVLYYAVLALLLATGLADAVTATLSWSFVISRAVHSFVHLGGNVIIPRFWAFVIGFIIVMLMWAWFGLRLFVIG